jgi:hypothetical protein
MFTTDSGSLLRAAFRAYLHTLPGNNTDLHVIHWFKEPTSLRIYYYTSSWHIHLILYFIVDYILIFLIDVPYKGCSLTDVDVPRAMTSPQKAVCFFPLPTDKELIEVPPDDFRSVTVMVQNPFLFVLSSKRT